MRRSQTNAKRARRTAPAATGTNRKVQGILLITTTRGTIPAGAPEFDFLDRQMGQRGQALRRQVWVITLPQKPMQIVKMQIFKSSADFRQWLAQNHAASSGIWLRFCKKASGEVSVTYAQAL